MDFTFDNPFDDVFTAPPAGAGTSSNPVTTATGAGTNEIQTPSSTLAPEEPKTLSGGSQVDSQAGSAPNNATTPVSQPPLENTPVVSVSDQPSATNSVQVQPQNEGTQPSTSTLATPQAVPISPIEEPWRETKAATGRIYYYKKSTRVTTWTKPPTYIPIGSTVLIDAATGMPVIMQTPVVSTQTPTSTITAPATNTPSSNVAGTTIPVKNETPTQPEVGQPQQTVPVTNQTPTPQTTAQPLPLIGFSIPHQPSQPSLLNPTQDPKPLLLNPAFNPALSNPALNLPLLNPALMVNPALVNPNNQPTVLPLMDPNTVTQPNPPQVDPAIEAARIAEEQRLAAEAARIAEEQRLAAEAAAAAEAARIAEEERLAAEAAAEAARIAEEQRLAAEAAAEAARIAAEQLRAERLALQQAFVAKQQEQTEAQQNLQNQMAELQTQITTLQQQLEPLIEQINLLQQQEQYQAQQLVFQQAMALNIDPSVADNGPKLQQLYAEMIQNNMIPYPSQQLQQQQALQLQSAEQLQQLNQQYLALQQQLSEIVPIQPSPRTAEAIEGLKNTPEPGTPTSSTSSEATTSTAQTPSAPVAEKPKEFPKIFRVRLPNEQRQVVPFKPELVLRSVLIKICSSRGLTVDDYVAKDNSGNPLDIDKTLGELNVVEISFNTVRDGVVPQDETKRKAHKVMSDLYEVNASLSSSLLTILKNYRDPLLRSAQDIDVKKRLLSEQDCNQIFASLESIASMAKDFNLQWAAQLSSWPIDLADIVTRHSEIIPFYAEFVSNYKQNMNKIEELRRNSDFNNFVDGVQKSTGSKLRLEDMMSLPAVKITAYSNLLEQLITILGDQHPNHLLLKDFQTRLVPHANQATSLRLSIEAKTKLIYLENHIAKFPRNRQFIHDQRVFFRDGIIEMTLKKRPTSCFVVLFTDLIIVSKAPEKKKKDKPSPPTFEEIIAFVHGATTIDEVGAQAWNINITDPVKGKVIIPCTITAGSDQSTRADWIASFKEALADFANKPHLKPPVL